MERKSWISIVATGIAILSCSGGAGDGGQSVFACSYTEDSSVSCGNGSPGSSHKSECVEVHSEAACTTWTQGNTDCTEGCCSSSRFSKVTVTPGPCPQADAGSSGDAGSDGGAQCPRSAGTSSCDACLYENCCSVLLACANDTDCRALSSCQDACKTAACQTACATQHPSGNTKYAPYYACGIQYCTAPCQ